jgi:hypothetical protein
MKTTSLSAAGRGLALALLVAGAVWLATLPAVTCHSTEFLGCMWPTVATVALIAVGGISTSLLGARLLGLPRFWLIALSGCAAMYAGAFALVGVAPGLPHWVGFTTSALLWFPAAAMLAQPNVSRWLRVAAAVVLGAMFIAAFGVVPAIATAGRQQQTAEKLARSGVPLAVPEVQGFHAATPSLEPAFGGRPDTLSMLLVADRGDASLFVEVFRPAAAAAPCDLTAGLPPIRPGAPCHVLGQDRWEFRDDIYDVVVIRHGDALVVVQSPRQQVSSTLAEAATVRDVSAAELAHLS